MTNLPETIKEFQKTNEPVDFVKMGLMGKTEDTKVATGQISGKAETIDDRIKYAQSWNLAVALVAPSSKAMEKGIIDGDIKLCIEFWQQYFHEKLKNKN